MTKKEQEKGAEKTIGDWQEKEQVEGREEKSSKSKGGRRARRTRERGRDHRSRWEEKLNEGGRRNVWVGGSGIKSREKDC